MDGNIFRKFVGKLVRITVKPNEFVLVGYIDEVWEDCIEFRTRQKTSFLDFDVVTSISEEDGDY